jgi:hypothetical protein
MLIQQQWQWLDLNEFSLVDPKFVRIQLDHVSIEIKKN